MEGNDVLKRCAACDEQRPRDAFSGKQWGVKAQRRRCTACVASGAAPRHGKNSRALPVRWERWARAAATTVPATCWFHGETSWRQSGPTYLYTGGKHSEVSKERETAHGVCFLARSE